jgi:hypothetical protein
MKEDGIVTEIATHLAYIIHRYTPESKTFQIHMYGSSAPDYPRMAFTYYTLARTLASRLILNNPLSRQQILDGYAQIFTLSARTDSLRDQRYAQLYGMRLHELLNEPYTHIIDAFIIGSYASLFSYPVATYVFLSTYFECPALRDTYPFADSLKNTALSAVDHLLFSNELDTLRAFHVSEISAWQHSVPPHLYARALDVMRIKFAHDTCDSTASSSGLAKSLEHFARIGDTDSVALGMRALASRRLSTFVYRNPTLTKHVDTIYAETPASQHSHLDTSAHLIHMYLNLYENI